MSPIPLKGSLLLKTYAERKFFVFSKLAKLKSAFFANRENKFNETYESVKPRNFIPPKFKKFQLRKINSVIFFDPRFNSIISRNLIFIFRENNFRKIY